MPRNPEYEVGDRPFARDNFAQMHCPFCGGSVLKQAYSDIDDDDLRVTLYCNNPQCDVREFTILAMAIGQRNERADVMALEMIDDGLPHERLPEVVELGRDSLRIYEHRAGTLARRRRPTTITLNASAEAPA